MSPKEKKASYMKEYNKRRAEEKRAYEREYKKANKEKESVRHKKYVDSHKEERAEYLKEYMKTYDKDYWKKYRKENPEKSSLYSATRRVLKRKSSINLTRGEKDEISKIYKKCKRTTRETDVEHEVDHIIPLAKGGLHHPSNLQIITKTENRRKGTKLCYYKKKKSI